MNVIDKMVETVSPEMAVKRQEQGESLQFIMHSWIIWTNL